MQTKKTKAMKPKTPLRVRLYNQRYLYLLMLPAVICLILFSYAPMSGLYMAFTNYSPSNKGYFTDLFGAPFVGMEWFDYFFKNDFGMVMRNTMSISFLTMIVSFPMPIILAVLLNEVQNAKAKKFVQTSSYLPYFISWVIAANMCLTLLSKDGVINDILRAFHVTEDGILFMQNGGYFKWIIAFLSTWKSMGYNAIIYLAAISGIDQELYEAAEVDGATRMQRIRYITLPTITPTISILLILAVGGILNTGFEKILLMQNDGILSYSDVLDTYSYRYGMQNAMYSYGTAVGMFKSVVSFILVVTANKLTRKMNGSAII